MSAELSRRFARLRSAIRQLVQADDAFGLTMNTFCPTGKGGGVDPTCGKNALKEIDPLIAKYLKLGEERKIAKAKEKEDAKKPAVVRLPNEHQAVGKLKDALTLSNLPRKEKQAYSKAIDDATNKMPKAALNLIAENLKDVKFYESTEALTIKAFGYEELESGLVNGAYMPKTGIAHLDGNIARVGSYGKSDVVGTERTNIHETYAHELMHAMDGEGFKISGTAEWKQAFDKEINVPGKALSNYAKSATYEGFAEFGRALYGAKISRSYMEKKFPLCSAVFKQKGLWP